MKFSRILAVGRFVSTYALFGSRSSVTVRTRYMPIELLNHISLYPSLLMYSKVIHKRHFSIIHWLRLTTRSKNQRARREPYHLKKRLVKRCHQSTIVLGFEPFEYISCVNPRKSSQFDSQERLGPIFDVTPQPYSVCASFFASHVALARNHL